jgi:beta-lactamase regulating signal transducer with metallopeptidase domain
MTAAMNSSWMFVSTIVTLLLVLAATALEQVASLRRGVPLRWIWVAAMALSIGLSASWLPPGAPSGAAASSMSSSASSAVSTLAAPASSPIVVAAALARRRAAVTLPVLPNLIEIALRRAWLVASAALLLLLLWSGIRLWRDRRTWTSTTVLDAEVLVSDGFGPAIVGIMRPAIVVPQWVLALDDAALRTIVVHEEEHRRAGDPRVLLAALALVVLMPWNVGLWLIWRRLNRAVELDCDERVLSRGVRGGDYANVLLTAWQRSRGSAWLPTPAFAERVSGLGKRVEHLMRPEPRRRAMKTVTGSFVALVLVATAMLVPAPQRAQGVGSGWHDGTMPLVLIDGVKRKDLVDLPTLQAAIQEMIDVRHDSVSVSQSVDSANAVMLYGSDGIHGATAMWTKRYLANGGAMLPRNIVKNEAVDKRQELLSRMRDLEPAPPEPSSSAAVAAAVRRMRDETPSELFLQHAIAEYQPGATAGQLGQNPTIWLVLDENDVVVRSATGRDGLSRMPCFDRGMRLPQCEVEGDSVKSTEHRKIGVEVLDVEAWHRKFDLFDGPRALTLVTYGATRIGSGARGFVVEWARTKSVR